MRTVISLSKRKIARLKKIDLGEREKERERESCGTFCLALVLPVTLSLLYIPQPSNVCCDQVDAARRKKGICTRRCSAVAIPEETVEIALKKAVRQLDLEIPAVQRSTLAPLEVHNVRLVLDYTDFPKEAAQG